MKYIKLVLTIIKNFFLIIFYEGKKLFRKYPWAAWAALVMVLVGVVWGGVIGYKKYQRHRAIYGDDVSLSRAAKIGEATTQKLMVQIENPKGNPEDVKGRYQRGDIVLIKPGNFEFSEAEKTGFLILHMDLTEKQAEILVKSKQADTGKDDPGGRPQLENLARRRYAVDLGKVGISGNDQGGREITDKIYTWDILFEKE